MYYNVIIVNIVTIIINKFEWVLPQDLLALDREAGQIRHGSGLRTQKNWILPQDPLELGLAMDPFAMGINGSNTRPNFLGFGHHTQFFFVMTQD